MQYRAATRRQIAHSLRAVHPSGADFATDLNPIDAAREGPPQHLRQSRDRGEDADRIAVDEHQARVRIDIPDVVNGKNMVRRLQDPLSARKLGIKMLQKTAMEAVGIEKAAMPNQLL